MEPEPALGESPGFKPLEPLPATPPAAAHKPAPPTVEQQETLFAAAQLREKARAGRAPTVFGLSGARLWVVVAVILFIAAVAVVAFSGWTVHAAKPVAVDDPPRAAPMNAASHSEAHP